MDYSEENKSKTGESWDSRKDWDSLDHSSAGLSKNTKGGEIQTDMSSLSLEEPIPISVNKQMQLKRFVIIIIFIYI